MCLHARKLQAPPAPSRTMKPNRQHDARAVAVRGEDGRVSAGCGSCYMVDKHEVRIRVKLSVRVSVSVRVRVGFRVGGVYI